MIPSFEYPMIFGQGADERFYRLENKGGKVWYFPERDVRTGFCLYQPSAFTGVALKRVFPVLHRYGIVRWICGADRVLLDLNPEFRRMIAGIFGVGAGELSFAVFCGTPGVHRKITIQFCRGKEILGYCKVSNDQSVSLAFDSEVLVLEYLRQCNLGGVPKCLFSGSLGDGINVFIQSTWKTSSSSSEKKWGDRQEAFLRELHEKTVRQSAYEQTDFCADMAYLREHLNAFEMFGADAVSVLGKSLDKVSDYYAGKTVDFSVCHGDFTPWNMYVENDRLYVFDFEYSRYTYPPFLDYFHYCVSIARLTHNWNAARICSMFAGGSQGEAASHFPDMSFGLVCYLLSIISIYIQRSGSRLEKTDRESIRLWVDMLERL